MKKTLKKGKLCLIANTNGGYIDVFEKEGKSIFFPKVMVKIGDKLKVRGGMHICAPNFGADEKYNELPQHGFLRNLEWNIDDLYEDKITLSVEGIDDYHDVKFILDYELRDQSLWARLTIINNSKDKKPVAPGFHPYFHTNKKEVIIDDTDVDKKDLPNSIYKKIKNQKINTNENDIEIIGLKNIYEYVFWTDFMGDYICIEPTYSSNSFKDPDKDIYKLDVDDKFIQEIEIKIKD